MSEHIENTGNSFGDSFGHARRGHVTKPHEYREDGLPKTDKYVVDKKPKINPHVSSPSKEKEEAEPSHRTRVQ